MTNIFTPPQNIAYRDHNNPSIFLAGSIEMGIAKEWQKEIIPKINNWNIFNPRREDWVSSWVQEIENPQFYQQVNWELEALEQADIILMYFDPETKSSVSMLELGLYAKSGKIHVICPEGFWRKGNIDIICSKYNIPQYENVEDFLQTLNN